MEGTISRFPLNCDGVVYEREQMREEVRVGCHILCMLDLEWPNRTDKRRDI